MYVPSHFLFRENQLISMVEVSGECDKKYSYIYLLKTTLTIISLAECCEGKLIAQDYEKAQTTDKNRINFSIIFPNKYKMQIFREMMAK